MIIAGYYGTGNIGDEAILYSMINRLKSNFEIIVLGYGFKNEEHTNNVKYELLPNLRKPSHVVKFLKMIMRSDALIMGGGGYLANKLQPTGAYYWLSLAWFAKLFRKKVIFFAIGAGPFKKGISSIPIKFVLNRVDAIILRDDQSEHAIKNLGVRTRTKVMSDIVFLLQPSDSKAEGFLSQNVEATSIKVLIVMPLRFHISNIWKDEKYRAKYERYVKSISQLADFVAEDLKGIPIFLPFAPQDIKMYSEIIALMRRKDRAILSDKIDYDNINPDIIFGIMKNCDLVLGGRYHSVIFSIIAGIPVIPVIYHPKLSDLVTELGLRDTSLEVGDGIEWPDVDLDLKKAMELLSLCHRQQKLPENVELKHQKIKKKAEEGLEMLMDVIQN